MRAIYLVAAIGLASCAHRSRLPEGTLAATYAATDAAETAGAKDIPSAAKYLSLAEEQLALARRMDAEGIHDAERVRMILARAKADAELALTLVGRAHAEDAADELATRPRRLEKALRDPADEVSP